MIGVAVGRTIAGLTDVGVATNTGVLVGVAIAGVLVGVDRTTVFVTVGEGIATLGVAIGVATLAAAAIVVGTRVGVFVGARAVF